MMAPISIEYLPIEQLKPYEKNPRTITPEELEKLKRSITTFGLIDPLIIDDNNMIIGGHQRLKAAAELGIANIPVVKLTGLSEDQKKTLNISLNKISGEWNEQVLFQLLEEIKKSDAELLKTTGFTDKELSLLFKKYNIEDEKTNST